MREITPESVETSAAPAPAESAETSAAAAPPAIPAPEKLLETESDKAPKAKASALVKEAQEYITNLFAKELSAKLTYHTIGHTEAVVKECRALAPAAKLSADDTENLLLAA